MAQDRSSLANDNTEAEVESDIELIETDASSCSAVFSSHAYSGQPAIAQSRTPRGSSDATSLADMAAAAASVADGAVPLAGSGGLAETAAEHSVSQTTASPAVVCDGSTCEQDRLLKELIGKLAEQGGCSHEQETPMEADADSDYVRIEPHEAHDYHMNWSGSSVSSRFSFLVPRVHSDEDLASQPSEAGDFVDEIAPSGHHDADDREESDQALSPVTLSAADGIRPAHLGPALQLQQPQLLQPPLPQFWLRDGEDVQRAALGDVEVTPLVRHYKHSKNSHVNHVLSIIAVIMLVLAVGIGIGHNIGSAREATLQRQIRDDQDSKLRELREDLLMCLRKQEDISQTIAKLNEIEAILVDAEHWRNEYEELLKLKVQAEEGWRQERTGILDQLEQSKAELNRVVACHRDTELLSRQQVKLDDVHAKLQAALDQRERQVVDQQLASCKASEIAQVEATKALEAVIKSKSRAIALLKERVLDRDRELIKLAATCSAAAARRGTVSEALSSTQPVDHERDTGDCLAKDSIDGQATCQERLATSLPLDSRQDVSEGDFVAAAVAERRSSSESACWSSRRRDVDDCWTASRSTIDGSSTDEAEVLRCARLVLVARERRNTVTAAAVKDGGNGPLSSGQRALDRSLRLYAASSVSGKRSCSGDSRLGGADSDSESDGGRRSGAAACDGKYVSVTHDANAEASQQRTMDTVLDVAERALGAAKLVASSSLHVLSKAANSSLHVLSEVANSSLHALSKAANSSLHALSKAANSSLHTQSKSENSSLLSAIDRSMGVLANVTDRWLHVLSDAADNSMNVLSKVADSSVDVASSIANRSLDVVTQIAERAMHVLSKPAKNSSLPGQINESATPETTEEWSTASTNHMNMTKVREAAAAVRAQVHRFGNAMQEMLSSVADAVKRRSMGFSSTNESPAPLPPSSLMELDSGVDDDEAAVDRSQPLPAAVAIADSLAAAVDESQFWAEFKELRQLVNNYTERAGRDGETDRTYKVLLAFVQRYGDSRSRRGVPPGSEWRAWCDCQLVWWSGRLKKLDAVHGSACGERLADWQVDALEAGISSDMSGMAPAASISEDIDDPSTSEDSDDRRKTKWLFERAAEREFVRETPDDWYWRKMGEAYSKVYRLFTDRSPPPR